MYVQDFIKSSYHSLNTSSKSFYPFRACSYSNCIHILSIQKFSLLKLIYSTNITYNFICASNFTRLLFFTQLKLLGRSHQHIRARHNIIYTQFLSNHEIGYLNLIYSLGKQEATKNCINLINQFSLKLIYHQTYTKSRQIIKDFTWKWLSSYTYDLAIQVPFVFLHERYVQKMKSQFLVRI